MKSCSTDFSLQNMKYSSQDMKLYDIGDKICENVNALYINYLYI